MPDSDGTNALVLHFNGAWGDPPGPTPRRYAWPLPELFVAYVDENASDWFGLGVGSRYHPFESLNDGRDTVQPWGRVVIASGHYAGPYTFDTPVTLEPWGEGVVTIGE